MQKNTEHMVGQSDRLFVSLAEQLGEAYLQIARLSELAKNEHNPDLLEHITTISEAAMKLTESYVRGMRSASGTVEIASEPVSVSSLLYDAEQALRPYAAQRNVQLEIADIPKLEPVLCDRAFMHSALVCLGQVFVMAESAQDEPSTVRLDAYRTKQGIATGLYSANSVVNGMALRRAKRFFGQAEQPFSLLVAGAATGVFVADKLLNVMQTELRVARHDSFVGLAATLPRCNQIQLV